MPDDKTSRAAHRSTARSAHLQIQQHRANTTAPARICARQKHSTMRFPLYSQPESSPAAIEGQPATVTAGQNQVWWAWLDGPPFPQVAAGRKGQMDAF